MRQPRAMIAAATIAILLAIWMDRPLPVKDNQVPYCVVDRETHFEVDGKSVRAWVQGYGPCSDQDIYRDI